MAIETVKEYFKKFGIEHRVREFEVSSATVELAAKGTGVRTVPDCQNIVVLGW